MSGLVIFAMSPKMRLMISTVALICICLGAGLAAPATAPDFSRPRAAVKSFYQAIESGDTVTIRAAMLAEDDQQRMLADAFTNVIVASQKLALAARDKFGAAADSLQTSAIPKEEAARIDKAQETIDGQDATLVLADQPAPIRLRKVDADWKIRASDFAGATPANITAQIDLLAQLAQILNDTASGISAGKFTSPEQVQSAFQERFNAAMIQAVKPATKSTTKP
jgi:hypothetical protein